MHFQALRIWDWIYMMKIMLIWYWNLCLTCNVSIHCQLKETKKKICIIKINKVLRLNHQKLMKMRKITNSLLLRLFLKLNRTNRNKYRLKVRFNKTITFKTSRLSHKTLQIIRNRMTCKNKMIKNLNNYNNKIVLIELNYLAQCKLIQILNQR